MAFPLEEVALNCWERPARCGYCTVSGTDSVKLIGGAVRISSARRGALELELPALSAAELRSIISAVRDGAECPGVRRLVRKLGRFTPPLPVWAVGAWPPLDQWTALCALTAALKART